MTTALAHRDSFVPGSRIRNDELLEDGEVLAVLFSRTLGEVKRLVLVNDAAGTFVYAEARWCDEDGCSGGWALAYRSGMSLDEAIMRFLEEGVA